MTYKTIYKTSMDSTLNISKRQNKLEGMLNKLVLEVRDSPPRNKRESDRYWYKAVEISREIWRVCEGQR